MSKRPLEQDDDRGAASSAKRPKIGGVRLTREDYTVGWISALVTEHVAAQEFLDERHEELDVSPNDNNNYTLGRVGKHNVVIAVLPDGEYGTARAATVAGDMQHSFPNIKVGLMVGIGGGAPSQKHDIRLGDIVVSAARDGIASVLQYDFGKTIQDETFQMTQFLNQPSVRLRTAVSGLKAKYERHGQQIGRAVESILEANPRLRNYQRPPPVTDRLYLSEVTHPRKGEASCSVTCNDPATLVVRVERTDSKDEPAIHYGLIASANQLMKDAKIRDKLAAENGVLCFEMEAAGLMNTFPYLVIRGICDYSDTHKNKDWQGYAAMVAAAYTRDLLYQMPAVETERHIGMDPRTMTTLIEQCPNATNSSVNEEQRRALMDSLRFGQIDARRTNIKRAHAKTCKWLLQKSEYRDWLDPSKLDQHKGFLWMKGKPGAGKSTLMKFIFDQTKKREKDWIITSFFFNARGADLEKSTVGMYRSLLLQLLERQTYLQDAFERLEVSSWGKTGYQAWGIELLKDLFEQAIRQLGKTATACFIDALDECDEVQTRDMVSFFQRLGELATSNGTQFRVFFSSRHYPHITFNQGLSLVLEGLEEHDEDIASYIKNELKIGQSNLANRLRAELQEKSSGVFIWVVLVVGILNKEHDEGRSPRRLQDKLKAIPGDLHELFRDILTRDSLNRDEMLLCIQWVLFARQPMKPKEFYFAVLSGTEPEDLSKWDSDEIPIDTIKRFILNSSKGLAEITKSKVPSVQFIHESVRDFLLKDNGLKDVWPQLGGNLSGKSHERLKQCCLTYMGVDVHLNVGDKLPQASSPEAAELRQATIKNFPFLEYAVQNVLYHAESAEAGGFPQRAFLDSFRLPGWLALLNLFEKHDIRRHTMKASLLYILAEYNMSALIRAHSSNMHWFDVEDERYGPPIFAAIATGSDSVIQTFLNMHAEIHPQLRDVCKQNLEIERIGRELRRDFKYSKSRGVVSHLAEHGAERTLAILLHIRKGTEIDSKDGKHRTPLSWAASHGHRAVIRLLIDYGANVDATDKRGRTPLVWAAEYDNKDSIRVLLEHGAQVDSKDNNGRTPLSWAATRCGNTDTLEFLLKYGAEIDSEDNNGRTPLSWAATRCGNTDTLEFLLEYGAEIDSKDNNGRTPLSWAATRYGNTDTLEFLLKYGAEIDSKDNNGRTPLSWAATGYGNTDALKLLLKYGAEIDSEDDNGRMMLSWEVTGYGNTDALEFLTWREPEYGAEFEFGDIIMGSYGDTGIRTL